MTNQEINLNIVNPTNTDILFDVFGQNQQSSQNNLLSTIAASSPIVYNPFIGLYFFSDSANLATSMNSLPAITGTYAGGPFGFPLTIGKYNPVNNAVYLGGTNYVLKIVGNFAAGTILINIPGAGIVDNLFVHPISGNIYFDAENPSLTYIINATTNVVTSISDGSTTTAARFTNYLPTVDKLISIAGNWVSIDIPLATATMMVGVPTGTGKNNVLHPTNNSLYVGFAGTPGNVLTIVRLSPALTFTTFAHPTITGNANFIIYHPIEDLFYIAYSNVGNTNTSIITMTPAGVFGTPINTIAGTLPYTNEKKPMVYNAPSGTIMFPLNGNVYVYQNGALTGTASYNPSGGVANQVLLSPTQQLIMGVNGTTIVSFSYAPLSITGSNFQEIANRINAGAYLVDTLKIISKDLSQFTYPLIITNTSLTSGADNSNVWPIDNVGSFLKQNVAEMNSKSLSYFIASLEGKLQFTIKANNTVNITIKGKYYQFSNTLKSSLKKHGKLHPSN